MTAKNNAFVTSKQAAEILGYSHGYVRHLLLDGKLKGERLGRNWFVKLSQLKNAKRKNTTSEGVQHGSSE